VASRVVIVPKTYPAVGPKGPARTARYLGLALQRLGCTVEIIAPEDDQSQTAYRWETHQDPDGFAVTRVRPGSVVAPRQAVWRALEHRGPFDAVITTQVGHYGQPAVMVAREWGVPVLAHVSGTDVISDLHDPFWAPFVTWTVSEADRVTAATPEMAAIAGTLRQDGRVDVWPEPATPAAAMTWTRDEAAVQWGLLPGEHRIGVFGAAEQGGGLIEALTAFGLVRRERPGARLILSGNLPVPVQRMVEAWMQADPESGKRLQAVPPAEDSELPGLLAGLDQVWLPMRLPGQDDLLLAALAAGVPVVATGVGMASQVLRDGENGLLVPINDAHALAMAGLRVLQQPEWARQISTAARQSIPSAATFEAFEKRLATCLRELGVLS
jgi:glycosyltransferase involved in cell wall biosynthesis